MKKGDSLQSLHGNLENLITDEEKEKNLCCGFLTKGATKSKWYSCSDCGIQFICEVCVKNCHTTHHVQPVQGVKVAFCYCACSVTCCAVEGLSDKDVVQHMTDETLNFFDKPLARHSVGQDLVRLISKISVRTENEILIQGEVPIQPPKRPKKLPNYPQKDSATGKRMNLSAEELSFRGRHKTQRNGLEGSGKKTSTTTATPTSPTSIPTSSISTSPTSTTSTSPTSISTLATASNFTSETKTDSDTLRNSHSKSNWRKRGSKQRIVHSTSKSDPQKQLPFLDFDGNKNLRALDLCGESSSTDGNLSFRSSIDSLQLAETRERAKLNFKNPGPKKDTNYVFEKMTNENLHDQDAKTTTSKLAKLEISSFGSLLAFEDETEILLKREKTSSPQVSPKTEKRSKVLDLDMEMMDLDQKLKPTGLDSILEKPSGRSNLLLSKEAIDEVRNQLQMKDTQATEDVSLNFVSRPKKSLTIRSSDDSEGTNSPTSRRDKTSEATTTTKSDRIINECSSSGGETRNKQSPNQSFSTLKFTTKNISTNTQRTPSSTPQSSPMSSIHSTPLGSPTSTPSASLSTTPTSPTSPRSLSVSPTSSSVSLNSQPSSLLQSTKHSRNEGNSLEASRSRRDREKTPPPSIGFSDSLDFEMKGVSPKTSDVTLSFKNPPLISTTEASEKEDDDKIKKEKSKSRRSSLSSSNNVTPTTSGERISLRTAQRFDIPLSRITLKVENWIEEKSSPDENKKLRASILHLLFVLFQMFNLDFTEAQEKWEALISDQSAIDFDLQDLLNEYFVFLGEEHVVVKILKCASSQGVVAPVWIFLKTLLSDLKFSDKANTWHVSIKFTDTNIYILHKKTQTNFEKTFEFTWHFNFVFRREDVSLIKVNFNIVKLSILGTVDTLQYSSLLKLIPWYYSNMISSPEQSKKHKPDEDAELNPFSSDAQIELLRSLLGECIEFFKTSIKTPSLAHQQTSPTKLSFDIKFEELRNVTLSTANYDPSIICESKPFIEVKRAQNALVLVLGRLESEFQAIFKQNDKRLLKHTLHTQREKTGTHNPPCWNDYSERVNSIVNIFNHNLNILETTPQKDAF